MDAELEAYLADVEKINGVPEVVSLYGFKVIEVNQKKYLTPMSKEEAERALSDAGKDIRILDSLCYTRVGGGCISTGCTGRCVEVLQGPWVCICNY